jgi:uncharacterized membrane protein
MDEPRFPELCELAFSQIRRHGADSIPVVTTLFDAIHRLADKVRDEEYRRVLGRQALQVLEDSLDHVRSEHDRQLISETYGRTIQALAGAAPAAVDGAHSVAAHRGA